MAKKLYIDLEKCRECETCEVKCSYFYHPYNNGIIYLREIGEFATTCRKCEKAPCVASCPHDALEKQEDGKQQHRVNQPDMVKVEIFLR